jgi:hypothetical protein
MARPPPGELGHTGAVVLGRGFGGGLAEGLVVGALRCRYTGGLASGTGRIVKGRVGGVSPVVWLPTLGGNTFMFWGGG